MPSGVAFSPTPLSMYPLLWTGLYPSKRCSSPNLRYLSMGLYLEIESWQVIKMSSLAWTLMQCDYVEKFENRDMHTGKIPHEHEGRD